MAYTHTTHTIRVLCKQCYPCNTHARGSQTKRALGRPRAAHKHIAPAHGPERGVLHPAALARARRFGMHGRSPGGYGKAARLRYPPAITNRTLIPPQPASGTRGACGGGA